MLTSFSCFIRPRHSSCCPGLKSPQPNNLRFTTSCLALVISIDFIPAKSWSRCTEFLHTSSVLIILFIFMCKFLPILCCFSGFSSASKLYQIWFSTIRFPISRHQATWHVHHHDMSAPYKSLSSEKPVLVQLLPRTSSEQYPQPRYRLHWTRFCSLSLQTELLVGPSNSCRTPKTFIASNVIEKYDYQVVSETPLLCSFFSPLLFHPSTNVVFFCFYLSVFVNIFNYNFY